MKDTVTKQIIIIMGVSLSESLGDCSVFIVRLGRTCMSLLKCAMRKWRQDVSGQRVVVGEVLTVLLMLQELAQLAKATKVGGSRSMR